MASICRSKTIYPRSHTSTLEIAGKPLQSNLAGQNRPESPRYAGTMRRADLATPPSTVRLGIPKKS